MQAIHTSNLLIKNIIMAHMWLSMSENHITINMYIFVHISIPYCPIIVYPFTQVNIDRLHVAARTIYF
jgi:hypothetical protein